MAELYVGEEVDRVVIVYNRFVSPLVQEVVEQEVLPIPEHVLAADEEEEKREAILGDFIYEPEPEQILERLLPVYVETELYRALLESAASEQGARMTAMRNASKNAGELIDTLTLAMNRARQAEITQEILEVVAGADALTQYPVLQGRVVLRATKGLAVGRLPLPPEGNTLPSQCSGEEWLSQRLLYFSRYSRSQLLRQRLGRPLRRQYAPGAVIDQNNPYRAPPCSAYSWRPTDSTTWMAQTFTPRVSGALTDVVLRLEGTAQTVNVALTPVDATGRPVAARLGLPAEPIAGDIRHGVVPHEDRLSGPPVAPAGSCRVSCSLLYGGASSSRPSRATSCNRLLIVDRRATRTPSARALSPASSPARGRRARL